MAGPSGRIDPQAAPGQRLDLWLFRARLMPTREAAAALASGGHLRLNARPCRKPGHALVQGDVLTFPQGGQIRVLRVLGLGHRRGPAPEARALYLDLSPPDPA